MNSDMCVFDGAGYGGYEDSRRNYPGDWENFDEERKRGCDSANRNTKRYKRGEDDMDIVDGDDDEDRDGDHDRDEDEFDDDVNDVPADLDAKIVNVEIIYRVLRNFLNKWQHYNIEFVKDISREIVQITIVGGTAVAGKFTLFVLEGIKGEFYIRRSTENQAWCIKKYRDVADSILEVIKEIKMIEENELIDSVTGRINELSV
jgi:hypothetical protein